MSTASVNKQIRTAMKDAFVTRAEAKAIVKEAERGLVTVGEAKAIADLYDRCGATPAGGARLTLAIPEFPGDMRFQGGAKGALDAFFFRHNIPAGTNAESVKAQVRLSLEGVDLGAPLAKVPTLGKLYPLALTSPLDVARDVPMQTAHIDLKKQEFFLQVGASRGQPQDRFFGPFSMIPTAWTAAVGEGPSDVVAVTG
jgi:hypothetical protein